MTDVRIALLGAARAGKSTLLATIAAASGAVVAPDVTGASSVVTATARRRYVLLDAPAAAVPHALAGAQGAVLVVSATDGLLPDSKSQVQAALAAGVRILAAYLVVPPDLDVELAELVELEINDMCAAVGTGIVPVIRSSRAPTRPRPAAHGHGMPEPMGEQTGIASLAAALDAAG